MSKRNLFEELKQGLHEAHEHDQKTKGQTMDYKTRITIEPGKRGGKPCIRSMRITVYDVLDMLAQGMSQIEIIEDFPELEAEDITACLMYAADREHKLIQVNVA